MHPPTHLWNRNFLLLWQGKLISLFGSSLGDIALMLWIVDVTNSATYMGTVMMAASIISVALGPIGGALADRYSRKNIVVLCDMAYGMLSLLMAGIFLLYSGNNPYLLPVVFLLFIGMETLSALFGSAAWALKLDLIPLSMVPTANAFDSSTAAAVTALGKGSAGILYQLLGAPVIFLLDGITFLFSGLSESLIRSPQKTPDNSNNWGDRVKCLFCETVSGFSYVWQHNELKTVLFLFAILNFALEPIFILMPFFVKDPRFLGATDGWFGYIMAGFSIGLQGGYWLTAGLQLRHQRFGQTVFVCLIALGASYSCLGFVRQTWVALVMMSWSGILVGMISNYIQSIIQTAIAEKMRGRALSVAATFGMCLSPFALGLSGIIADALDRRMDILFFGCGIMVIIIALCACLSKNCRRALGSGIIFRQMQRTTINNGP